LPTVFLKTKKCTNLIVTKQKTKHALYQVSTLTCFSAPRCHLQEVSLQQRFVGPTNISGTIHPYFHHRDESLKTIKFKLHIHTAATPMSHNDKPPVFLTYSRFIFWAVLYRQLAIFDPKGSPPVKWKIFTQCVCVLILNDINPSTQQLTRSFFVIKQAMCLNTVHKAYVC